MSITLYIFLSFALLVLLFYPLVRKAVALWEVYVQKYTAQNSKVSLADDGTARTLLTLKLQAYERVILFVERMKPDSMVPRTLSPKLTAAEYQHLLLTEVRREYEYNLSQQLYLSEEGWAVVTDFKNNVVTLINTAASEVDPAAQAGELAKKVLEQYITSDIKPDRVIQLLKGGVRG